MTNRRPPCWLQGKHSHDRSGRYCYAGRRARRYRYAGVRLKRWWWLVVDRITGRHVRCRSLKQARLWMEASRAFAPQAPGP